MLALLSIFAALLTGSISMGASGGDADEPISIDSESDDANYGLIGARESAISTESDLFDLMEDTALGDESGAEVFGSDGNESPVIFRFERSLKGFQAAC